jgi:hypothetical protein
MIVQAYIDRTELGIEKAICDMCGLSLRLAGNEDPTYLYNYEYLDLNIRFGYGSLLDGDEWSAQICEACVIAKLDKIIRFKKDSI